MEDVRNQKSWSERQPSVEEGDEQKDEVEEEQDIYSSQGHATADNQILIT